MSHGPVMLDLRGLELSPEERERLRHPATGGVILFARNYESPQQVHRLITEIHELRTPALLVAVDQEGGRVQRFRQGLTRLPPAAWYAHCYGEHSSRAEQVVCEAGWLMAAELGALGVDFSFAPVLDLDHGISEVIGDRAFATTPSRVAALAQAWTRGARQAGMSSVGKHFPGHGAVGADSHSELPLDKRSFTDIWLEDMLVFRHLIENGLEGIMPAHVVYPAVDRYPAGFSRYWLQTILRGRLGFQGVVFSDDLNMAAAQYGGDYPERAQAALSAGCDMILVCNNPGEAGRVIETLVDYRDPIAQSRLVRLHGRARVTYAQLREDPRWRQAVATVSAWQEEPELSLHLVPPSDD